jgi:ATP-dependent Lhr-like helicase
LPELLAAVTAVPDPPIAPPPSRAAVAWTRGSALAELMRGRIAMLGPVTPLGLGSSLGLSAEQALDVLIALESEGVVLRGWFSPGATDEEWCDRRLLARIHRATLQRLRAEIQPVTIADFMRFLFEWQHVTPSSRLSGVDGVRQVIGQLDGFELGADAWDKHVLPLRVAGYDGSMLDLLCYSGESGWARLSEAPVVAESALLPPRPIRATPVALFLRQHLHAWRALAGGQSRAPFVSDFGRKVILALTEGGAQFTHEIADRLSASLDDVRTALAELVWAGLIASDGFSGLRAMWNDTRSFQSRSGRGLTPAGGRWAKLPDDVEPDRERAIEEYAAVLLQRYGIVCRRVLTREPFAVPWRELLRVLRRMEARGEVRGGRFVSGLHGEQFALPEAVELARRIRRTPPSGETIEISAADPLNLCGIIIPGERVPAVGSARIVFRDGVPAIAEQTSAFAEVTA